MASWSQAIGMFILACVPARAEQATAILGTWQGTSLCVDRQLAPACKDEQVVYVFSPGAEEGHIALAASKVVQGVVEPMGDLDLAYDATTARWSAELQTPRVHALWSYAIEAEELVGSLVDLPSGKPVRRVSARRPAKQP